MKLSGLRDEDLREIAKLKNKRGCATSEAKRAAQILRARNVTLGFSNNCSCAFRSNMDNPYRDYKTFDELHGMSLIEYLRRAE